MAKTLPSDPGEDTNAAQNESRNALIERQLIESLGRPRDLLKVQVRPLGGERYRVNILTGKDYTTGRIANSFFLTADEKGKIVSSSPAIVKLY